MSPLKQVLILAIVAAGTGLVAGDPAARPRSVLYVTNSGGNDVTVVDVATNRPIGSIETGDTPHGLEASRDGSRLYVSGETDNDLVAIDTATSKVLWKARVGGRPNHIALSADDRYVYVPIRSADYVDVVDGRTGTKVKSIPVGRTPHNSYRAPNGQWVYVTSMAEQKVTIVDVASQSAIGSIPVGGEPRPAAVTSDNRNMYVALTGLHGYVVVDIAQRKMVGKVELPPAEVSDVSTYGYTPTHGIALRPDNKQFWITNVFANAVEGFSEPDHKLLATVPVGKAPNWMTFGTDGRTLYVSNPGSNDVSVIDSGALREVARVPVGLAPKRLLVVDVPKGMGSADEPGWKEAARRPSTTDYYLKGGGILSAETRSFASRFATGTLTLETAPALYRKLGLRGISINAEYLRARDKASLDRIRTAIRREGRILTALVLDDDAAPGGAAADRVEELRRGMRVAHDLGAPVVVIGVGKVAGGGSVESTGLVERAIAGLQPLLPTARELGLKLAIDADAGSKPSVDDLIRIVKGTDPAVVGASLDFGEWQGKDAAYFDIAKLAPYVSHTHVKAYGFDNYGDESTIDYRKALAPLQKSGYGAAVSIEYAGRSDSESGVVKARDLLVKLWIGTVNETRELAANGEARRRGRTAAQTR
jgi:YVTN family beta-propeller protein